MERERGMEAVLDELSRCKGIGPKKAEKTWKLYAAAEDRRALGFKSPPVEALLLMERRSVRRRAGRGMP